MRTERRMSSFSFSLFQFGSGDEERFIGLVRLHRGFAASAHLRNSLMRSIAGGPRVVLAQNQTGLGSKPKVAIVSDTNNPTQENRTTACSELMSKVAENTRERVCAIAVITFSPNDGTKPLGRSRVQPTKSRFREGFAARGKWFHPEIRGSAIATL